MRDYKIITIISDSLGMVRPINEYHPANDDKDFQNNITYKNIYAYLLQLLLGNEYHVLFRGQRARMSDSLVGIQSLHDDIIYNDSSVLVLHLGIVDCAPRLVSRFERRIISMIRKMHLSILAEFYLTFKSKHRLFFTKYFPIVYVPLKKFENNLNFLVEEVKRKSNIDKIVFINIADTTKINKNRSFNFDKNIQKYNEAINAVVCNNNEVATLLDFYAITHLDVDKYILSDGIHLTSYSHMHIANLLYKIITKDNHS